MHSNRERPYNIKQGEEQTSQSRAYRYRNWLPQNLAGQPAWPSRRRCPPCSNHRLMG
jgi:hypothetical protein